MTETILVYEDVVTKDIPLSPVQTPASCGITEIGTMHFNGANHAFADGHIRWLATAQFIDIMCDNIKKYPIS